MEQDMRDMDNDTGYMDRYVNSVKESVLITVKPF